MHINNNALSLSGFLDVCLQICYHCIAPIQMFVKVLLLCPRMAVKLIMKRSNKNSHQLLRLWTQLLPIVAFQNHKQESQVTDPSLCSISSPLQMMTSCLKI